MRFLRVMVAVAAFAAAGCATQHSLLYEGMAHFGAGRNNEAVAVLTEAAAKPGPDRPWVHKMRAGAYMRLGRFDLALPDMDMYFATLKNVPGAADNTDDVSHGFLMRGSILLALGRLEAAEADLEACLALNPSKWHAGASKSLDALDEIARDAAKRGGRGWLGLALRAPTAGETGIPVLSIVPGGPAEKAGMRSGDAILARDGVPVASVGEFPEQIAATPPGTTAQLDVVRGGAKIRIAATIEDLPFRREERRYYGVPAKPSLSEEARRFRVQAEAAVERKAFADAADRYRDALRIAPWWPDGHFNRALILAELGRHALAIREMKRYLLLSPDAPDARAARDRIYVWEGLP